MGYILFKLYRMEPYYYLDENQQQKGPIFPSDFMRTGITRHTLLWKSGMAGWQAAGNIPELAPYFRTTMPPPPPPGTGASDHTADPRTPQTHLQKPNTFLIWSILATALCCLPLGIVAILFSVKADSQWSAGRYEEAYRAAEKAKICCIVSAVLSVISYIGIFLFSACWW